MGLGPLRLLSRPGAGDESGGGARVPLLLWARNAGGEPVLCDSSSPACHPTLTPEFVDGCVELLMPCL